MKIKLIYWEENQCKEKADFLNSLGHQVELEFSRDNETFKRIKSNPPNIYVLDLSRLPSHGKEIAIGLRQIKTTRNIPIIFTDGNEEKISRIKEVLPDAVYTHWSNICSAIKFSDSQKEQNKIIPKAMMER